MPGTARNRKHRTERKDGKDMEKKEFIAVLENTLLCAELEIGRASCRERVSA